MGSVLGVFDFLIKKKNSLQKDLPRYLKQNNTEAQDSLISITIHLLCFVSQDHFR